MKKLRGIYEHPTGSGCWWIQYFDADGKRRREKAGTRSNAIKLREKRKTEVLQGKKLPELLRSKPVAFSDLAADALEYSSVHKLSARVDKSRMKFIISEFGSRVAEAITAQQIDRWLREHDDWRPATANRYRALMSLAYRLGIANGKVKSNPARLVRQRREDNGRLRFLSPEEEAKLRETIGEKFPQFIPDFDIALNTGMRKSEQYGLDWSSVDLARRIVTIGRSKHGGTRHIALNSAAITAFQALHQCRNGQRAVFLNRLGQPAAGPREWFEDAVEAAGIKDFTWHCLRHTFASRLVMKGVDIRTVQELMGHKTIQMTVRYAHLAPQHKLAAVERLCDNLEETSAIQTATGNSRQRSEGSQKPH